MPLAELTEPLQARLLRSTLDRELAAGADPRSSAVLACRARQLVSRDFRRRMAEVRIPAEVTDAIRSGVVSIPHGWGHDLDGVQLEVARANAGVNSNLLADETLFDPISGNAVLNGIPVTVEPAS